MLPRRTAFRQQGVNLKILLLPAESAGGGVDPQVMKESTFRLESSFSKYLYYLIPFRIGSDLGSIFVNLVLAWL